MPPCLKSARFAAVVLLLGLMVPFFILPLSNDLASAQTSSSHKVETDPADQLAKAKRLFQQGTQQFGANHNQDALQLFQQALAIYRDQSIRAAFPQESRAGEGQTLKSIGNVYLSLKEYAQAIPYQQQALEIARAIQDADLESRALNNLGIAYGKLGQPEKEIDYLQRSLIVAQRSQNVMMQLTALGNLTSTYENQKQFEPALEAAQQRLAVARQHKEESAISASLIFIGRVYRRQGADQKAIPFYQQALEIAQAKLKDPSLTAEVLEGLSLAYSGLQDYPKAIQFAEKSLVLYQQQNQASEQITLLWMIAVNHNKMAINAFSSGNPALEQQAAQKALQFAQEGLSLAKKLRQPSDEALLLGALGDIYKRLDDYDKSLATYKQSLTIYQSLKDQSGQLAILLQLMRIHSLIGSAAREQKDNAGYLNQANQMLGLVATALPLVRELKDLDSEKQILEQQSDAYSNIGTYYLDRNELDQAETTTQTAQAIARQSENWRAEMRASAILGGIYDRRGEYRKQGELRLRDLEVSRKLIDQPVQEVHALLGLAGHYQLFGNLPKSIEFAQQALAKAEAIDITKFSLNMRPRILWTRIGALRWLTLGYQQLGEYDQALEFAQRWVRVSREIANPQEEVWALIALGKIYANCRDFPKAIETVQQAWELAKTIKAENQPKLEVDALVQLSPLYSIQENHPKALELAQQALKIAQQSRQPQWEQDALWALSKAYNAQGKISKALELLQKQVALNPQIPNALDRADSLVLLGETYLNLGDYPTSRKLLQQAIAEATSVQHLPTEAMAWYMLSWTTFAEGNSQKAVEFAEKGLAVARDQAPALTVLANLALGIAYGEIGNDQKAVAAAQTSLAVAKQLQDRDAEKRALILLGSLHRKFGRPEVAITTYQAALATGKKNDQSNTPKGNAGIYAGLAKIYANRNHTGTAISFYKQAINDIQETRRNLKGLSTDLQKSFLQATFDFGRVKTADIYRQLADLLLAQGRILEAQQVLELLKVQEIQEFTRSGNPSAEVPLNPVEQTIKQKYGSLIAFGQTVEQCKQTNCPQKNQLLDQLDELTRQYNQTVANLEQQIRQRRPTDDAFLDPSKLGNIRKIVEAQPGTVLIYPFVLEDKTWLLWAAPGGVVKSLEVPVTRQQLGEAVLKFRQSMRQSASPQEIQTAGKQLYDWLIKPLEPELKANKIENLVFSLDRVTRYIPMSALFDGEKYLIENYSISTVLSADLTDTKDRLPAGIQNIPILAMGASNFKEFSPLPNVPEELDGIVRNQAQDAKGVYPGQEFLDQAFDYKTLRNNLSGHKILHIATHGAFVPGKPEDSYLVLGNNQKLTTEDIKALSDLNQIHLVVLSACETALGGPDQDGVEISGISSYFLTNGVAAVMASLWSVSDQSTSVLMQRFYGYLAQSTAEKPITKVQALRLAQLSLLYGKDVPVGEAKPRGIGMVDKSPTITGARAGDLPPFAKPFYWAPFILIGNGL